MANFERFLLSLLLALLVAGMAPAGAQPAPQPNAPSDDDVRELEQRLDSLRKQVDQIEAAKDAATRQALMEQSWRGMQDYMGWMHSRWGAGSRWMMDPGMTGPGSMGCPMLGGTGAAWPTPEGTSPEQYGRRMGEHMGQMHEQMSQLGRTQDPAQRQRLLQEHWQTMYRDMQSMRGMGWMWHGPMMGPGMMHGAPSPGGAPASLLPDAGTTGAKLVSSYCVQCHAAPPPTLHTSEEWASVIGRMNVHMTGSPATVRAPSQDELQTILAYMQGHAR